eukprot:426451_1
MATKSYDDMTELVSTKPDKERTGFLSNEKGSETHKEQRYNKQTYFHTIIIILVIIIFGWLSYITYLFKEMNRDDTTPTKTPTTYPIAMASKLTSVFPTEFPTEYPTGSPTKSPTVNLYQHYIGDYKISAQSSSHGKWLLCDGSYLSTANYPELFKVIGYTFGKSSSLFALPDARNRVVGIAGNLNVQGTVRGKENISLSKENMPSHFHHLVSGGEGYQGIWYSQLHPYLAYHYDGISSVGLGDYSLRADATDNAIPDRFESSSVGNNTSFSVIQPTAYIGNLFIWAD